MPRAITRLALALGISCLAGAAFAASPGLKKIDENFNSRPPRGTTARGPTPLRSRRVTVVDDSCWH